VAEMERNVIHVNVADFAVAVERVLDPRLNGRPVILAREGAGRSAVYDMSEEAFKRGVRKGMPITRAVKLAGDAKVLVPRPDRYALAMRDIVKEASWYSPLVEAGDDDGHVFLDVTRSTRLFGPPVDVAFKMGRKVKKSLGFAPTWSVAANKLTAKVATRIVKPTGECVVGAGDEEAFLAPLPLHLLPGIERDDLLRFKSLNLTLAMHLAAFSIPQLEALWGGRGRVLFNTVRGVDPSPVLPAGQKPPRAFAEHVFGEDANDVPSVERAIFRLAEQVGKDLRARSLAARLVRVSLDFSDGLRRFGNASAHPPTSNDFSLFDLAQKALASAWTRRVRIRRIALTCDRLCFPSAQMELFPDPENEKRDRLMHAVDLVRARFGREAMLTGRTMTADCPLPTFV